MKKKMMTAVVIGTFSSGVVSPIISYASTNDLVMIEEVQEGITQGEVETEEGISDNEISESEEAIEVPETSEPLIEESTDSSVSEEVSTETSEETSTTSESTEITENTSETKEPIEVTTETSESKSKEEMTKPVEETTSTTTITSSTVEATKSVSEVASYEQPTSDVFVVKNQTTEDFIESISDKAREVGQEYNLYASVMIAQAILETGSGKSTLSQAPNYNLFGIKGSYKGQLANFYTNEDNGKGELYTIQASFRKYPSYKESFEDYAELLTNTKTGNGIFYQGVLKKNAKTYKEATKFLTGRYATDTQYNQKLDKLIEAYDLTFFDKKLSEFGSIQARYHEVKTEDSLVSLLTQYDITKKELLAWNKDVKETELLKQPKLIVGQEEISSYLIKNNQNKQESRFVIPLKEGYVVSSPYGQRGFENHNGIDLAVAENTPVYASSKGKVVAKGFDLSAGNYLILEHENGLKTSYFHLNRSSVGLNQAVAMGEMIGYVGSTGNSTGPHLHFTINVDLWSGYMNPANYLNFK